MNIVITGASAGIGFDTALRLSQNPNHRIWAIARSADKLQQLKAQAAHANIDTLVFDMRAGNYVTLFEQLSEATQKVGIDVLVNNAGNLINKPFEQLTDEDWLSLYEINVLGAVRMVRTLLPLLGQNTQASHVVNIGSMGGFQGSSKFVGLAAYSASKAALANVSECMAEEFKTRNIAVNCLCLGAVQTDMLAKAFPDYTPDMSSHKIAEYLAWFAEFGHQFQNGKVIPVSISTP